ncbi:MAG: GDP-mannose 4,6-dehydratase [Candidatus Binatia bacterium]|nr:GDP-mannose 4,6-dehydratase [Candidatus Binatia bacterium]
MRVLILGVTGFAGGYLAKELVRGGDEVWGAARARPDGRFSKVVEAGGNGFPMLSCDITDAASVSTALQQSRPDAVAMLAGLAFAPVSFLDPAAAYRVHAVGAVNVMEEVVRLDPGIRVLLVTSSEVYGAVEADQLPVTEETPLRPNSLYAASKAAADLAGRAFALSKGANVVRVRPFNHTGPGQKPDFVCPDFASQIAAIAQGRKDPVMEVGNLAPRRDFTDVRDIVRGYAAALEKGRAGEAYNLCQGRAIGIGEILSDLCGLAGVDPEIRTADHRKRAAEVNAHWGSAEKARSELGWQPEVPWSKTLKDLLAASMAESSSRPGV